mmetsp:Transcript_3733/g.14637  ORF Transcript_3733/g.14637 Transcript_3733/m.14637 type:complete len:402 (+) Transcript_3733:1012-2217(+)
MDRSPFTRLLRQKRRRRRRRRRCSGGWRRLPGRSDVVAGPVVDAARVAERGRGVDEEARDEDEEAGFEERDVAVEDVVRGRDEDEGEADDDDELGERVAREAEAAGRGLGRRRGRRRRRRFARPNGPEADGLRGELREEPRCRDGLDEDLEIDEAEEATQRADGAERARRRSGVGSRVTSVATPPVVISGGLCRRGRRLVFWVVRVVVVGSGVDLAVGASDVKTQSIDTAVALLLATPPCRRRLGAIVVAGVLSPRGGARRLVEPLEEESVARGGVRNGGIPDEEREARAEDGDDDDKTKDARERLARDLFRKQRGDVALVVVAAPLNEAVVAVPSQRPDECEVHKKVRDADDAARAETRRRNDAPRLIQLVADETDIKVSREVVDAEPHRAAQSLHATPP